MNNDDNKIMMFEVEQNLKFKFKLSLPLSILFIFRLKTDAARGYVFVYLYTWLFVNNLQSFENFNFINFKTIRRGN